MGGLLEFLNGQDARLGLGLLAAGGPSTVPLGFGQRIQGAMQGLSAEQDAEMKRQYLRSQMEENASQNRARQIQMQRDQTINSLVAERFRPRPGAAQQTPGAMPGAVPPQGLLGAPPGSMPPTTPGLMAPGGPQPMQAPQGMPPGAGPGMPQGGSSFPLSMEDIATLGAVGFKGADSLFGMYKYANDGVKRDAGAYYEDPMTGQQRYFPKLGEGQTIGPNGEVSLARGYAQSNATAKGMETGAIEAAKYPYAVGLDRSKQTTAAGLDMMPVEESDGNSYFRSRLSMAPGQAGGGGMGGAGGMGGSGGNGSGGGFMAKRSPITQQSSIALNDNWIKNAYQPAIEAGRVAADLESNIQALRNIDFKTGWGEEARANAASVLAGLGIGGKSAEMYAANAQKFQSVAMDKLMTTLAAQKGTQVEGDANRAKQTFVSLGNTPQANEFILDLAQAKANADRKRAQYYERALPIAQAEDKGDLTEVNRQWMKVQKSVWDDPMMQKWGKK
jgi:hypothetical protein